MSRYRKVDPRFWKDETVRTLDPIDKLVALYVFTGQSNRIGLFSFSPGMAAEDTGLSVETFTQRCRNVCRALKWEWEERAGVIYLPTWWKYDQPPNPNNVIGCLTDLDDVPHSPVVAQFCADVEHLKPELAETFRETLAKRYPKRLATPEPYPEPLPEPLAETHTPPAAVAASVRSDIEAGILSSNGHGPPPRKTRKPKREDDSPGFAEVWAAYPNHDGSRALAVECFRARPADVTVEMLLASIAEWKQSDRWLRGFVPYFERWLKEKRWQAEPRPASGLSPKTSGNVEAVRRFADRMRGTPA